VIKTAIRSRGELNELWLPWRLPASASRTVVELVLTGS
jgi:hypothetical protein